MFPNAMMQLLLLEAMYEEEEALAHEQREKKKRIRKDQVAMELPDDQFFENYHVTKEVFNEIMRLCERDIPEPSRASAYPKAMQVLSLLKWLACGDFQNNVAKDAAVVACQSGVSKIINRLLPILEDKLCSMFIQWPHRRGQRKTIKEGFYAKHGIPTTLGVIACTHVEVMKPENEHLYLNQYDHYSMNVSLVCDHKGLFIAVDATHPGATHNSEIWNESHERCFMEKIYDDQGEKCWLLGDKAYPLEPWLISPFRTFTQPDINFNKKFASVRSVMTRNINLMKSRWKILTSVMNYRPEKIIHIVNLCCALHNMCKMRNVPDVPIVHQVKIEDTVEFDEIDTAHPDGESLREEGAANRDVLKDILC